MYRCWSCADGMVRSLPHCGRTTDQRLGLIPGTGPAFTYGKSEPLFPAAPYLTSIARSYDLAPDGSRFIMIKSVIGGPLSPPVACLCLALVRRIARKDGEIGRGCGHVSAGRRSGGPKRAGQPFGSRTAADAAATASASIAQTT